MRLITWNINSLRLRLPSLAKLITQTNPDVICLQETKVDDPEFPLDAVKQLGFAHVAFVGMKSYNGVAILSKLALENIHRPTWCDKTDCRHIIAQIAGMEIHNIYVPAGGDEADPSINPKFAHKLAFLDSLTHWYQTTYKPQQKLVLVGDLNIAPLENDVWSHKQLLKIVSHTPIEVEKLTRLQQSLDWFDAVRHFVPPEQKLYSWWSYRAADWQKNDKGRRLDHIWLSPALREALMASTILRECRGWDSPSDHVPIVLDLEDKIFA